MVSAVIQILVLYFQPYAWGGDDDDDDDDDDSNAEFPILSCCLNFFPL